MKPFFLFAILLTACVGAHGQNYTLPPITIDSAIYEIRKGRACDSLQRAQAAESKKLGEKALAQGEVIRLQEVKEGSMQFIIDQWSARYDLLTEAVVVQKKAFKARLKRLWRVVIVEGVAIVVLVIILI
jgi:hypothetical protein